MIHELYVNKVKETAVNAAQSKITSIRKKSITKSGCRVYDNGFVGISGTLGEASKETFKEAEKNLNNKIPYDFEAEKNKKRTVDLRKSHLSSKEFVEKCEELLKILREEFPGFIFSNQIKSVEEEFVLKNDAGLEYKNIDRYFSSDLAIKDKDSINIIDTGIFNADRDFNIEAIADEARAQLNVFKNKLPLPKKNKIPVIADFSSFGRKIIEALNGFDIGKGASIFSHKVNKKVFSKDFTVYLDRSEDNFFCSFF